MDSTLTYSKRGICGAKRIFEQIFLHVFQIYYVSIIVASLPYSSTQLPHTLLNISNVGSHAFEPDSLSLSLSVASVRISPAKFFSRVTQRRFRH